MMEDTLPPASMVLPRNAHSSAANLADPNDPGRRKKQLRYQKHVSTRRGGGGGKEEQPLRVTVMPASSPPPAAANAGAATAAAAGKQPQTLADRRTRILRRQLRSAPTGDHKDTLLKKLAAKKHQVLTKPPAPAPLLQQTAIAPDPPSILLQDESDAVYQEFDIVSGQRSHDMGPSPTSFSEPEDAFMNGSNDEPGDDNYDNDDIYDTTGSPDHAIDRYAMANPSYEAVLADALTESVDHDEYDDDDDVDDDCVDNQVLDLLQQNDEDDDDDSAGWDTRHVLEHPPEPVQHYESAVAVDDVNDAWDTSQRISFGDGEEKKSHDVDDVPSAFDPHEFMSSDGVSDVDFSAVSISQVEDYLLVETRRLAAEQQRQEKLLERKETVLPKDNEALLADSDTRSDVPGMVESDALPQQQRIENYLKLNEGHVSSDDDTIGKDAVPEHEQEEDDDGDDDDGENDQDAADTVQYVLHDAVANEQDLDEVPVDPSPEGEKAAYAYSSFEPANRAANEAEEMPIETTQSLQTIKPPRPTIQVENLDMLTISQVPSKDTSIFELSLDSVVGEGFLPGGSVGANSVYSRMTKDSARSSTRAEDSSSARKALPMIKPPPEEKLKKWEEQKMRPLKHLEAVKKEKAAETSNKVDQPLDLFTQMESTEQRGSMFGLDDEESVMYAKMTVGAITERQSGFGSVSSDGAKAKWKNSRKEDQAETQAELEQVAPEAAVAATPPIVPGDIFSDAASESVAGPPEILRKHQTAANSLMQQQRVLWNGSTEPVPVDGSPVAQSLGEEPKSLHESIEADHHPTPTAQVSFALSDGSRSSKASIDKSLSILDSLKNSKIAAQVAVVSSTAERKFDERFEMAKAAVHAEEDDIVKAPPMTIAPVEDDFPKTGTTSFFSCGGGNSFLNVSGFDTVVEDEPFDVSKTVNLSVMKKVACIDVSSPSSRSVAHGYSVEDESHNTGVDLIGGAFSPWRNATYAKTSDAGVDDSTDLVEDDILDTGVAATEGLLSEGSDREEGAVMSEDDLMAWLDKEVFKVSIQESLVIPEEEPTLESILREKGKLEILCAFVAEQVNETIESGLNTFDQNATTSPTGQRKPVSSFSVPEASGMAASVLAANFVSYLQRISKLTGTKSPFDDGNPFLDDIIGSSLFLKSASTCAGDGPVTAHDKIFGHEQGKPVEIVRFFFVASESTRRMLGPYRKDQVKPAIKKGSVAFQTVHNANFVLPGRALSVKQYHNPPKTSPGPFETTFWSMPSVVLIVLGFLGDPVVVCRMKMVNQYCSRIIAENEHIVMRDAVRLGGMSMNVRPAFWIWITLEKGGRPRIPAVQPPSANCGEFGGVPSSPRDGVTLGELEKIGRDGKWHHVIGRDVARAFGNMPPHKTGARFRTDSIVRALITWGQGRVIKRGVKGGGEEMPTPTFEGRRQRVKPRQSTAPPPWEVGDDNSNITDASQTPTETVSDWGGVSPVGSFASSIGDDQKNARGNLEGSNSPDRQKRSRAVEELALSGNALTNDMKQGLQNQLGFILHALAAAHQDVGYCQGMDYVVAHLLRVLQDTVRWRAVKGSLPSVIVGAEKVPHIEITDSSQIDDIAIEESMVVEETVFRVMDCFFTSYNLRHMYWPELRCLKTCCLVFERLIQLKLPVLADHFEHHELNVGLFALGWFQTLFLYLPSMPSATVCHMWDIWLVERSFKIFFRVGTAILFLSQPILLNHEMEGMMTYLNTFPDATLLNPDILIACALQIKVTNKMLMEIESAVTGGV